MHLQQQGRNPTSGVSDTCFSVRNSNNQPSTVLVLRSYDIYSDTLFIWYDVADIIQNLDCVAYNRLPILHLSAPSLVAAIRLTIVFFVLSSSRWSTGIRVDCEDRPRCKREVTVIEVIPCTWALKSLSSQPSTTAQNSSRRTVPPCLSRRSWNRGRLLSSKSSLVR